MLTLMPNENSLSLKDAKSRFIAIYDSLNKDDKPKFFEFILNQCGGNSLNDDEDDCNDWNNGDSLDDPCIATLNSIANELKQKVPVNAVLSSEKITCLTKGNNADCLPNITLHVDAFLYNEDEVEDLVEEGKLQRNYCKDFGSKNTEPLIFISHSMSRDDLYFVFNTTLPTLENKVVLDFGSRLGAVLYGAYVFTDAPRIIGVEMNEDLCKLQKEMIQKYKMQDRVEVLHNKIEEVPEIVKIADIILLNNLFEFYLPEDKQVEVWQFLKQHIKKNAILVTQPHLETTFKNLDTGVVLSEWVTEPYRPDVQQSNLCNGGIDEAIVYGHYDTAFYQVL